MKGTTFRVVVIFFSIAIASQTSAVSQQALPPEVIAYADLILHNGKILTADDRFTIAQAVAIRDGKFLAVGQNSRILAMAGPVTQKIDLRGKTVTPGFLDTHYHLDDYAIRHMILKEKNIQWEGRVVRAALWWDDLDMALRDVKRAVEAAQPGEVVRMVARLEMEEMLSQITMEQLDAISPNHPLIIHGPISINPWGVNSYAIRETMKLSPGTPGLPQDGGILITGRARQVFDEYMEWLVPVEQLIPWFEKRMSLSNQWGLTLVTTRIRPSHFSALREIWSKGGLTVRWRVAFPGELDPKKVGNLSDIGDDMLRISGGNGGSVGYGSGWSFAPRIRTMPGERSWEEQGRSEAAGWARTRKELVEEIRYGWSIPNTHVKGDRATFEFLSAVEDAKQNPIVKSHDQRLTIDHLSFDIRPQEMSKMKELGVIPSISPWFVFNKQNIQEMLYEYGADRVNKMMPMKSYIQMGMRPSLESDSGDPPLGMPLYKIERAVSRRDDDQGRVWNAEEGVSRQEALWMSTKWSSYYTGDEDDLGSIEPGKLADLVVMEKDYMTVPEAEIDQIPIILTIVGGQIVYDGREQ